MKNLITLVALGAFTWLLFSCDENSDNNSSEFDEIDKTIYFDEEIFSDDYLNIYGKWKVYNISGGFDGDGYDLNFDYLFIKEYGIYGFIRNDSLIEFGKIAPEAQLAESIQLLTNLEKDENSDSFFSDGEKYVVFSGSDTLNLNSPCCDRYNYHFVRAD